MRLGRRWIDHEPSGSPIVDRMKEQCGKQQAEQIPTARVASSETYLDLLLRDILGLSTVSMDFQSRFDKLGEAYQIAHDYFAVAGRSSPLCSIELCGAATDGPRRLLDTADGRGSSGSASCTALRSATAATLAGAREDLVKGAIELAGHFC